MKRVLVLSILLLLFASITGQIIDTAFFSSSLNKTMNVDVYLPQGYNSNPNLYYPVIYFMHGWGGNQNSAESTIELADSLINYGIIDPVIIVCANNSSDPYLGSFYVNSIVSGNYEDYMIDDLIDWLESTYRVMSEKKYRTLMGQSMGGYACFRYGILHKDLFRALAAHAPAINFDLVIEDITQDILDENPGPPYSYNFYNTGILTEMIFAMSAAFSPNPNSPQAYINPQDVEFPLDVMGQVIDTVYQKWQVFDPVNYLTLQSEDSVEILFGAGVNDRWHLYNPNVAFKDSLDLAELDYEFYDHNSGHGMPFGFMDRSLKFLDSIMPPPKDFTCFAPSDLLAYDITDTTTNLTWTETGVALQWQIRLDTLGFDTTGMAPIMLTNDTITVDTLSSNTYYDWYIRAYCGEGDSSLWVGPATFKTDSLTRKAPYLLYDGVITEMQINWQLHSLASCTLDWGTDENYGSSVQTTEYGDDHQHKYVFSELDTDTKYYYKVTIGNEIYTGNFKTGPPDSSTEFSVFAYGDTRTYPANHDMVAAKILEDIQNNPSSQTFIMSSGDLVANGDTESDWDEQFFDPAYLNIQKMLRTLPYLAGMGNHDESGLLFGKYFPYSFYDDSRFYGSFDYANVHFVIVDQYTDHSVGSPQHTWLESDLSTSEKPWKIILLHEPGWSAGPNPNNMNVRTIIQPLCESYQVQFVIGGHNHYYLRAQVNNVTHLNTGGGGAPLYNPGTGYDSIVIVDKSYHYSKLSFDNNLCVLTAINKDGDTIESFSKRIFTCPEPSDLLAYNITDTTTNLTWTETGVALQWQIRLDTLGFDTTGMAPVMLTNDTITVDTLSSNTYYDWYIRAYCGSGDSSLWVGPATFKTDSLTRKAPYLLYDGVITEMQINWQLHSLASCTLDWGTDENYGSSVQTIEYGDDHQHKYVFSELDTDTKYYYKVTIGNEIYTGNFKTGPPDSSIEFSVFAYGDTRTYPANHDMVAAKILEDIQNNPSSQTFIMSSGDLVANGDTESDWDEQFFDPSYLNIQEMLRTLPYLAGMGNHDESGLLFSKYFPYSFYDNDDNRFYGSFDYANVHFVIVDQYTDHTVGSPQYTWLENDLSTSEKPWKIILLHEPGWSAGPNPNNMQVRTIIQPLCESYQVQFVIGGHNHYYLRAQVNNVTHLNTGGGGAPLYNPGTGYDSIVITDKSYHYCKLSFDNNLCVLTAINKDGDTIESFSKRIFTCPEPSDLLAYNITDTTTNLTWTETGVALQWQIRLDTSGFDTTGMAPVMLANDTITVDTLLPSTSYEWYIRAYCGEGDSSAWVGPNLFNTACGIPESLLAYDITDTTANLTWSETGVALQWQIRLDTLGFDTTGMAPIMFANDTITVDTLLPSTSYEWYIRAYCGEGDSSTWAGPASFNTACGIPDSLLAYDISDTTASLTWTETGVALQWQIRLDTLGFDTTGMAPIMLINDTITLDTLLPSTSYEWYVRAYCGEGDSSAWVGPNLFNTACGTPIDLLAYDITDTMAILTWKETGIASQWQIRLDTSGFDTTGVAPVMLDNDTITVDTLLPSTSYEWYIRAYCGEGDSSTWAGPATFNTACGIPDSLLAYDITDSTAIITWKETGVALQWQIRLDTLGFDTTGMAPIMLVNDTITVDTLLPSTSYEWYIRAYCGEGDSSAWVGPNLFNTACGIPDSLLAYNITDTTTTLTWTETGIASQWQIRLGQVPFDTLGVEPIAVFNDTISLDTLQPSTSYEWYVRAYCGEGDSSAWNGSATFNTACGIPDSLLVYDITDTTANLTWTETGIASQWQIRLDTLGFDTTGMAPIMLVKDTITVDTLLPSTSYEWYIRAYCGEGDSSAWVGPNLFNTACGTPSDLLAYDITDTTVILTWTETGVALQWQIRLDTLGFDTTGMAPVMLANDTITVDTLSPSTSYEWYVRAYCAEGDSSLWVGPANFNTACGIPDSLLAYDITDTLASLTWKETGIASQWQIRLGQLPFDTLGVELIEVFNDTIPLDSLQPSTSYEWYVRAYCGEGDSSEWVGPASFNTACGIPDSLLAYDISDTTAILTWKETGVALQWQIRLDTLGFDTTGMAPVMLTNDTITVDTLSSNTYYDWYIRAYCGEGDSSLWVGPATFKTDSLTRKAPYLLYDGVITEMQINWQLHSLASCTLDWGTDENYGSSVQTTEYGDDHQHKYVFSELDTDTKYYYKVTIGNEIYTGNFKTGPPDSSTEFSVFAYGDTRTYPANHDMVAAKILEDIQNNPSSQTFIMSSGDLVANGDTESDWDEQFFDPSYLNIQEMLRTLPYLAGMGNHDESGLLFGKYFPYSFYDNDDNRFYGSFDYANVHFVIVDQYTDHSVGSPQHTWLESDLSTSEKPWKIILLHEPGWSAGPNPNNMQVRTIIQPLCESYQVQFVIGGHNHYYLRAQVNNVTHLNTGGGGAPLYNPGTGYDSIVIVDKSYHYSKLSFDNNLCVLTAINKDGDTIESFSKRIFTCPEPSDLLASNILQTSADLSWTENGEATSWQGRFGEAGFDTIGVDPFLITENPYHVSGLTSNTDYDFYVRAYCGPGDSSMWVGPYSFNTLCDPLTADFTEYFDGVNADTLPDCWSALSSDTIGFVGTIDSVSFSVNNSVLLFNDSLSAGFFGLISPELSDLSSQANQIRFMGRAHLDTASLIVGTMADRYDTSTYSAFDTLLLVDEFKEFIVEFDTYFGSDGFIVLRHSMDSAANLLVDDFHWEKIPFVSVNTTDTTAFLLADTVDLYVTSNTNWIATENAEWLQLQPGNAYGNDTISIIYETNDSGHERTDSIVFSAPGIQQDFIVHITQEAPYYQPVWSNYPYMAMNIVVDSAIVSRQNLVAGDEIGIFDVDSVGNELCVGVGIVTETISGSNLMFIITSMDDPTTDTVDGYKPGNEILYKMLDSARDTTCINITATYDPGHHNEFTTLGTAFVSLRGDYDITQTIELMKGWNIHSFMVMPDSINMLDIHDVLIDSGYLIKVINEAGQIIQYFEGFGWFNNIGEVEYTEGYYIKVNADVDLDIEGIPVPIPIDIPLLQGWNIFSYPLPEPQDALIAVQELTENNELIKVISESGKIIQYFEGFGWFTNIGNFEPDEGYYIKVNTNTTLTLDYPAARNIYFMEPVPQTVLFDQPYENNPYLPMNILVGEVSIMNMRVKAGDEIAIYDNELCVGTGVILDNEPFSVDIITSKDDPTTTYTDGYIEGNRVTFKYLNNDLDEPIDLIPNIISGEDVFGQLNTLVCSLSGSAVSVSEDFYNDVHIHCYPNPTTGQLTISYKVPTSHVEIAILDSHGSVVEQLISEEKLSGSYITTFSTDKLNEGLYLVFIKSFTEDKTQFNIEKFIKKK